MPGLFITGTDTDVGKTAVSVQLINLLVDEGFRVAVMKPVASGAATIDGTLKSEDAQLLINASNVNADYKTVNPYVYKHAIAPHLAAEQAGIEIKLEIIKNKYLQLKKISDVVVVEAIGGWYAPLSMQATVADLAEMLDLPVVMVVGLRLGCLNHALLTASAINQSNLVFAGWIANHIEKDFLSAENNIETLKHYLGNIPFLGSVPYMDLHQDIDPDLDPRLHAHQTKIILPGEIFKHHLNKEILIDNCRLKN